MEMNPHMNFAWMKKATIWSNRIGVEIEIDTLHCNGYNVVQFSNYVDKILMMVFIKYRMNNPSMNGSAQCPIYKAHDVKNHDNQIEIELQQMMQK